MASRVFYIKKSRSHVRIKVVGTGAVTIPLSDLALADETPISPSAAITFLHWSVEQNIGVVVISRGGTPTQYLYGSDDWALAQEAGVIDNEFGDQDITVDIQGPAGMVFITLSKQGWKEPDTQAWDLDRNTLP